MHDRTDGDRGLVSQHARDTDPRRALGVDKLRSLRSTRWSMLAAIALTVGLPLAVSAVVSSHWGTMAPRERANRHPVEIALFGTLVAQLAIGVLGVLMISGEYSTGMIRATLGAVPKRLPALWAKAFVYAVTAFVLMLPSALLAFYGSQAILSKHQALKVSFSDPGVARAVVGAALYLTVVGVFAMAFGAITLTPPEESRFSPRSCSSSLPC